MLLMPFAGMPINTLHSLVLICTSYFPLMAFHMYSRVCVNVSYILMCIHHHLFRSLPCYIYLFEFNLLSLPFFRMATKKGKEKATPKPPARRGTKRALVAEPSSTAVKPSTKRVKRIIKFDEKEKAFQAKDTARFSNRYCEQMFPILA